MECPLPIDWLDWLEEPSSPRFIEHLEGCRSCQTVIALLQGDDLEVPTLDPPASAGIVLEAATGLAPAAGDLWVTAPADLDLDGALVLVLDDAHYEFERDWYEVAAADTATERATDVDLLLGSADTDVSLPLRVRFDHQGFVAKTDLRERIGSLTQTGQRIVDAALHGTVDESHWGLALEGPLDERLTQQHNDSGAVVQQLQMLYGARAAAAEDAELTFASALKAGRTRRALARAEFAEQLAERLALPSLTAKVKRYYADLENGLLSPSGLRPALVRALAQTLNVPWQQLEGLRGAWTPPSSAAAPVFARSASPPAAASSEAAVEQRDAVDDLFLGDRAP